MTPENEAKKAYLKRYRKDIVELEQCKQEVIQLRLKALPGGISYDGMPHGSGDNHADLANYAVALDEVLAKAEEKQSELLRDLQAITYAIDRVPDADCRILLRYKYIEGIKDWDVIADRMALSPDYIKRGIHSKALRLFIIPQ